MTIQKTEVRFRGLVYEVILEDGIVSYVDPREPHLIREVYQPSDLKITSMEGAKRMVLQKIEKILDPLMTFSD